MEKYEKNILYEELNNNSKEITKSLVYKTHKHREKYILNHVHI